MDIKDLIAAIDGIVTAIKAKNYWVAFKLCLKIIDQFGGEAPPVIVPGMQSLALDALADRLKQETQGMKGTPQAGGAWLTIVLKILEQLLPIILKEQG